MHVQVCHKQVKNFIYLPTSACDDFARIRCRFIETAVKNKPSEC